MRSRALILCTALAASLLAAPAHAAPDDAVLQMLQDKGLIPAAEETNAFVRQVREQASDLVLSAMNFLGVPYRRGGNTESGFDCSGFTRHVFEMSLGLVLPRRADEQAKSQSLLQVAKEELKPGDLVFFNTMKRAFSHVGIYIGDGKFIHSPRTGSEVRIEDMREAYWAKRYNGARRADLATLPPPAPQAR
jgi:cell wall-associated NlpC family hydrolase